jgi:hypothetical protein
MSLWSYGNILVIFLINSECLDDANDYLGIKKPESKTQNLKTDSKKQILKIAIKTSASFADEFRRLI